MYETVIKETTGVRLYQEEEIYLDAFQYGQINDKMDAFAMTLQGERHMSESQICEIYFNSPLIEEPKEQFLITIEKKGKHKDFILKRRNRSDSYKSEKVTRLSKKQYSAILKGSFEWMKDSSKLLVNEFYHKIKLFQYKIDTVITCFRQQMYLASDQLEVTIDRSIQRLFGEGSEFEIAEKKPKLAHLRIRCSNIENTNPPRLLEEWLQ